MLHEDQPFRVVGVLARTGTPVDRTVHVTLEGLDAVHADSNDELASDPLAAAMRARRGATSTEDASSARTRDEHSHGAGRTAPSPRSWSD